MLATYQGENKSLGKVFDYIWSFWVLLKQRMCTRAGMQAGTNLQGPFDQFFGKS